MLEDGRLVEVVAAPEPLAEIRGVDPRHMLRLAWHLGNRHLPTQIAGKRLRIRRDHVIEEMVQRARRQRHRDRSAIRSRGRRLRAGDRPSHAIETIIMITASRSRIITAHHERPRPRAWLAMITSDAESDTHPHDQRARTRSALTKNAPLRCIALMTWLSPAFPVGAFSYSSGIEWAVEAGDIHDAASLKDWLAALLAHGAGFCDGVLLAHAHRAAAGGDAAALADVANWAQRSRRRASGIWRRRRRAAHSSISRAPHGATRPSRR